jgi:hypothetical protein
MNKEEVIRLLASSISDGTPPELRVPTQEQINNYYSLQEKRALANFEQCSGNTFLCDNEDKFLWAGHVVHFNDQDYVYIRRGCFVSRRGNIERRIPAGTVPGTVNTWTPSMKEKVQIFFNKKKMVELYSNQEVRNILVKEITEKRFVKHALVVPSTCKNYHNYPIGYASLLHEEVEEEWIGIRPDSSKGGLHQKEDLTLATPEQVAWFFDHATMY